jgi:gluconolactonase
MGNRNLLWTAQQVTPDGSFTEGIEGPSCDEAGVFYACNFGKQGTIGQIRSGAANVLLELPEGSTGNGMVFDVQGTMYVADYIGHNVYKINMQTKEVTVHAHEPKMNQPNDLAITSRGIIFASDPKWSDNTGQLWRVDVDGTITLLETTMGTTNGLEVSPDEKTLYVNETVQQRIWKYDLDENGNISNKQLFYQFGDFYLDGMRCDVNGNLYVTRYGGSRITILSPTGEPIRHIELYGANCTNLAFGDEDGCTCFVTVADKGHVEAFRTDTPGRSWKLLEKAREKRNQLASTSEVSKGL